MTYSYRAYDEDGECVSDFSGDKPIDMEEYISWGNPETDTLVEYESDEDTEFDD